MSARSAASSSWPVPAPAIGFVELAGGVRSPIAADGKVFVMSEGCKLAALKAGPEWEVLAVSDFDDICHATPAIVDNTVYIRTRGALYAFGPTQTASN